MAEELLQELEAAGPVIDNLANIEDHLKEMVRDISRAVEGMKGSANLFDKAWNNIVMEVARGQTMEMQAVRPRLLRAFEKRLGQLKQTQTLATWLQQLGQAQGSCPDALLPEIAGMERLKGNVLDRWQSADDLEDLAARDYPLTTANLDKIGPPCKPPASFYAEESKPF